MQAPCKEDLRIQYQQCFENYRMRDRNIWQVPSVAVLVTSVILGVAFGPLKNDLIPSCLVLSFGIVLAFSMYLAVRKHQLFQYYTIDRIREIQKKLSLGPLPLVAGQEGMKP